MRPADNIRSGLAALVRERGGDFLRLRDEVLRSPDVETVHDLRVASRRLRAAVSLARMLMPGTGLGRLRRRIGRVTREVGQLRNLDEALLFFGRLDDRELAPLLKQLHRRRRTEQRSVSKLLRALPTGRIAVRLEAGTERLSSSAHQPIAACSLADISHRLFEPIEALLPLAAEAGRSAERHALRIAIKKWRYFMEITTQLVDSDYALLVDRLKEYQELLGKLNDLQVFGAMLKELQLPKAVRRRCRTAIAEHCATRLADLAELLRHKPLTAISGL